MGNIPKNPRNRESSDDDFFIFDEELYKNRFKIERSFAWLDGFKGLIIRYETLNITWQAMLYLGLIVNFVKKSLNRFFVNTRSIFPKLQRFKSFLNVPI